MVVLPLTICGIAQDRAPAADPQDLVDLVLGYRGVAVIASANGNDAIEPVLRDAAHAGERACAGAEEGAAIGRGVADLLGHIAGGQVGDAGQLDRVVVQQPVGEQRGGVGRVRRVGERGAARPTRA